MPHEKAPSSARSEILDVKTLSAEGKIRTILEIFDLSKDKAGIQARKDRFFELLRRYKAAVDNDSKARVVIGEPKETLGRIEKKADSSNKFRRDIHDQIMDLVSKMAVSRGVRPDQRELVQYLSEERYRVEEMIMSYYGNGEKLGIKNNELRQALRGEGWFTSSPGKKDD